LVTCNHVWEGFDDECFKDPDVKMCVCLDSKNPVYLDEKHLIDHDKQADLATFDMTELLSACGGSQFFDIRSKLPPKVKRHDTIFLIGFPGHGRNAGGDFAHDHKFDTFGERPWSLYTRILVHGIFLLSRMKSHWQPLS